MERRDRLVSDLAAGEKAIQAARERAYDAEDEVERREKAEQERKGALLSAGEEAHLIDSVMAGASVIDETREEADPELDKLKAGAAALRVAVQKLVARVPGRRERLPFAESAVRSAVKAVVSSSAALAGLLDETEEISLQLIRRKAILVAILDYLPDESAEMARAVALLQPHVFPIHHPEAEKWRAACERLGVDAGAELPTMSGG